MLLGFTWQDFFSKYYLRLIFYIFYTFYTFLSIIACIKSPKGQGIRITHSENH